MCILNSAELQNKIGDIINDKKLDPCNSGICRSSANANQNYICKCTQRQIIPEVEHCSEETCKSLDTKTGIFKTKAQSIKSKINTVKSNSENKNLHGLSKIKLKMSCICSQITSKPSLRHQKRKRENPGFYFKREKRNKLAIHNSNQDLQNQCYCRDKRCKRNSNGIYRCNLSEKGLLKDIIFQNENRRQHNFHRRKVIRIPSLIANRNETLYNCCICAKNTLHCEKDISTNSRFRNYLSCSSVKNGVNFNESDNLSMKNNYSNDEIKQCPCELESSSRMAICKRFLCHSLSNFRIKRQQKRRRITNGITNKNIKKVGLKTGIEQNPYGPKEFGDINKDHQCLCHHICECGMIKVRSKKNKGRIIKRSSKLKSKQKKKLKGRKNKQDNKSARKRRKEFLKEEKTFQKETKKKEKAERKKREKSFLLEKKQLEAINKGKEELDETSCLADFFLGLLKCAASILKHVGFIIFKVISDPKGSYRYVQQRLRDPIGTYERVKKAFEDAWRIKKLKIMKSLGGSDKMTILSDTLQDTAIYQAFAYKGKTKKEKRKIELENKQRKMRIMQRDKAALKNCKHMLLHTLRKTPCLWFYHVCPVFYPQCLGLLSFMHKFTDILLFLLAFMVWTPCIVCFEGCRAICCCILCTH
ncbi:uncharacterized protein LOC101745587 isoform X1 [Bombyx mori]|uniref:Uncharacterized protein n=1 Tax=Bombyx mori TaxID=7091 RepID=A0A8R2DPP5_BOMMO|nr:uncharacterized protein LOC101745587 isoform X1 [Bombyx mori]